MSDLDGLRELTGRIRPPSFDALVSTAQRRARRAAVATIVGAAGAAAIVVLGAGALTSLGEDRSAPGPADPPTPRAGVNGWVAVDADQGGGEIFLVRPGEEAHRLEVAGAEEAREACPAWSPDGTRLLFGRVSGSSGSTSSDAELVIVPVGQDGAAGDPMTIGLDGFEVLDGFDAHPCGTWAPDGRWVALAGTGEVWVVDTRSGAVRHLPDLRPSDLEWRPGSDQLAIAGDMGTNRAAPTLSAPVTVYSVSTGELRRLGAVEAAHITWSPDGSTLAYTGGEADAGELWLVDGDGANERLLVGDLGEANHGIGPVWSPAGDRIAYQRIVTGAREEHEVVLVDVRDGTETVIEPPEIDGRSWYPFTVSWSPDGTTLLYSGWSVGGQESLSGMVAVPADTPGDARVLTDAIDPALGGYSRRWTPIQMWGRRPG